MTKVPGGGDDDVICQGDAFTMRAMRRNNGALPAKEWYDGLDAKGKARVLAAFTHVEKGLLTGRPPAGRAEKVNTSRYGLWELRATPKGGTAPHLRVLYLLKDRTLWAAIGFKKQKNRMDKSDIDTGDTVTAEWLERR